MTAALDEQGAPIQRSEQSPDGDRAHVLSARTQLLGSRPGPCKPTQLIFSGAAEMHFRCRNGDAIARPGLRQASFPAQLHRGNIDADRLDVGIPVTAVASAAIGSIFAHCLVEESIARDIVVYPDQIRGTRPFEEQPEFAVLDPVCQKRSMPGMPTIDAAAKQVEAQPASLILELGLIG